MKELQVHEDARKVYGAEVFVKNLGKWGKKCLGCHDLVRRVDRQGETLIWCRKCSGYARQRMGPQLLNCCRPEQVGTKEHGKMIKRIQILEDGRVPAKEAKDWKIEGKKRRITRKECTRLINEFELEGLMAQKGLWNLAREKRLQERGAMPKEEGDVIREYNAMHDEKFPKQLAEGGSGRKGGKKKEGEGENQRRRKKGKREERKEKRWEKEENETVSAKKVCRFCFCGGL